jgi:hypothetical protein
VAAAYHRSAYRRLGALEWRGQPWSLCFVLKMFLPSLTEFFMLHFLVTR